MILHDAVSDWLFLVHWVFRCTRRNVPQENGVDARYRYGRLTRWSIHSLNKRERQANLDYDL
jgi:hypothetical protein